MCVFPKSTSNSEQIKQNVTYKLLIYGGGPPKSHFVFLSFEHKLIYILVPSVSSLTD